MSPYYSPLLSFFTPSGIPPPPPHRFEGKQSPGHCSLPWLLRVLKPVSTEGLMLCLHRPLVDTAHTAGTLGLGGGVCALASPVCFQTVTPPPSAKNSSFTCHLAIAPFSLLSSSTLLLHHPLLAKPPSLTLSTKSSTSGSLSSSSPQVLASFWVSLTSVIHVQDAPPF